MGRLYDGNVKKEYPNAGKLLKRKYLGGKALLQKNYGKAKDCTLTSLAFLYGAALYPQIEKIAERHGYDGDLHGTNPLTIKKIMQECNRQFGVGGTCHAKYGKGIGYTYKSIKDLIDGGTYVLLSLLDDGRRYYHNHTVTVIGYAKYERGLFLLVYDNWNLSPCYIDFCKLSAVSSINWTK